MYLKNIKFRNFLSFGNELQNLDLSMHGISLITGRNGAGKSSIIIESLTFALFGRSYRKINKNDLVNTVNKKDCEVILELDHNGKNYRIERGIKPAYLRVFENDVLLPIPPDIREYQSSLQNIFNINFKSFSQLILLGSASYVPFMELSANDRRQVIEDILGIDIITDMFSLEKIDKTQTDYDLNDCNRVISLNKESITAHKSLISSFESTGNSGILGIHSQIDSIERQQLEKHSAIASVKEKLIALNPSIKMLENVKQSLSTITSDIKHHMLDIERINKQIDELGSVDKCSHCGQDITAEHASNLLNGYENNIKAIRSDINLIEKTQDDLLKEKLALESDVSAFNTLKLTLHTLSADYKSLERSKESMTTLLNESESRSSTAIDDARASLELLIENTKAVFERRRQLIEKQSTLALAADMLKDGGIKSYIIKTYLPFINQHINVSLDSMDMGASIQFDDNFDAKILLRRRDEVEYESLSQGEKAKVNFSILLMMRNLVTRVTGQVSNILVLDEVLDGSADSNAIEALLPSIRNSAESVYIVSHRSEYSDLGMDRTISVSKDGNFSHFHLD